MAKPSSNNGEFYRDAYYTLGEFCHKISIPVKTVRTKYLNTGKLKAVELARGYEMIIPGYECARFFDELFGDDDGKEKKLDANNDGPTRSILTAFLSVSSRPSARSIGS